MPNKPRRERLRRQRNAFLAFLGAVFVALVVALPLVVSGLSGERIAAPDLLRGVSFIGLDRNHDGYVERSESDAFARAHGWGRRR